MFKNLNAGHGVVIGLGSFILFILFMIFIFPNGQQNAEVISENYYEEELLYQDVIDAKNNADNLVQRPVYSQSDSGIKIVFPDDIKTEKNMVNFELFRTNDSNLDVTKELQLSAANSFTIPATILASGSYTLKLKWTADKKPYQIDYDVLWKLP